MNTILAELPQIMFLSVMAGVGQVLGLIIVVQSAISYTNKGLIQITKII